MYRVEIARVDRNAQVKFEFSYGPLILTKLSLLKLQKKYEIFSIHSLTFIRLKLRSNDFWLLSPLKLEKIKHGFKTLAECGGIRGVDDTSSLLER
jgi:hypothetical protein